ncbi:MAG: hypothetical protein R3305_08165 [Gammaproteobacteria bacterium]|nr:hypothetical protein [Gammaproteobacteria bacterium]
MQTSTRFVTTVLTAAALLHAASAPSQPPQNLPVDLPDGPAKPGFDIERFSNAGNGWFETFYVEQTEPLREALEDGRLDAGTRMLVLETASGHLALVTDQMAYHHLAQGTVEGQHWLATF